MRSKTEIELMKAQVLRAVRNAVRLKHSFAADRELNDVLPAVEEKFDGAVRRGKAFELDVADYLKAVDYEA